MQFQEVLALPGNQPVFDATKELLASRKAVAFVGAGASAGMYPLWGKFIDLLADHAVAQGKAEAKDATRWKADTIATPQQRVNTIVRKLGEPLYRSFLRETFSARKGADGRRHTPVHAALLRLPFRGFVTTNYDPALEFARAELRPDCLTSGTPTWQDDDEVYRWRTGAVFDDECPILWAHGYWQRPGGIVLNSGEYGEAYKQGIYRDTFKELWIRERLVFLGFGFADPQFAFMVGEFLRDAEAAKHPARHIAILGWPMPGDGNAPDAEEIEEKRESLEADYHVRALFYPVVKRADGDKEWEDHSALGVLLGALGTGSGDPHGAGAGIATSTPGAPSQAAAAPAPVADLFSSRWVHETSDDAKFTGRGEEIARLDRWVRDATVRVLGICAVGGTGKTALAGHWLKQTTGWRSRPFAGLFAWSFYQERSPTKFLSSLLGWGLEVFGTPKPCDEANLADEAVKLLRGRPLIVVLDGLEVLQEGPDDSRHGSFLDGNLREFLQALSEAVDCHSLSVLTSRFVFADLERHLGTAFHQVELRGLEPGEGARLLWELGVRGLEIERREISERLDGHPLGLRVFAGALPASAIGNPREFLNHAFTDGVHPGSPLNDKLLRLLGFYEKQLPPEQVRLLSIVSLFRSPVPEERVLRLARALFGGDASLPDDAALAIELRKLHNHHILTREPFEGDHGYAAHPVLRDHFRGVLLRGGADTARRAADLLQGKPSDARPQSVKEIEPVLIAIELLLDAGEFNAANRLLRDRLNYHDIFQTLPALSEGLACAFGFVRDQHRRERCRAQLSQGEFAVLLNDVGLHASLSGHYELALRFYADSNAIDRALNGGANTLAVGLQNEAELLIFIGRLADANRVAAEALDLAIRAVDEESILYSLAFCGWAALLTGRVTPSARDFARASLIEKEYHLGETKLYNVRGIRSAELLFRTGHAAQAVQLIAAIAPICERNQWHDDIALCHAMLARCALAEGRLNDTDASLRIAEPILRRGQILYELARLLVTAGELSLARRNAPGALHQAAEAIALAAPRGMRLVHADALILRGKARLLAGEPDRARDDAEEGLRLARTCGYPWGERDGLRLLADAAAALADIHSAAGDSARAARARADSRTYRGETEAIATRLVLTEADFADADAKAKTWLAEYERKDE